MASVKTRIHFHIFKWFKPLMVGKYKLTNGKRLSRTRVSNTTHIGNPENLDISNNVFIGHFNFIDASSGITIQEGCQITNYVSILTHSSHIAIRLYGESYMDTPKKKVYFAEPVSIGKYTFIGPHSIIMPGTNIGKGSLVSAYSYVKGDFPDFSIIAGNPATVVGDTRKMDADYLIQYPELKSFYDKWNN